MSIITFLADSQNYVASLIGKACVLNEKEYPVPYDLRYSLCSFEELLHSKEHVLSIANNSSYAREYTKQLTGIHLPSSLSFKLETNRLKAKDFSLDHGIAVPAYITRKRDLPTLPGGKKVYKGEDGVRITKELLPKFKFDIVEEFIDGTEITFGCFVKDKEITNRFLVKEFKGLLDNNFSYIMEGMGGMVVQTTSYLPDFVENLLRDIAVSGHEGYLSATFIRRNAIYYFIEFTSRSGLPTESLIAYIASETIGYKQYLLGGVLPDNKIVCSTVVWPYGYPHNKVGEVDSGISANMSNKFLPLGAYTKEDSANYYYNGKSPVGVIVGDGNTINSARQDMLGLLDYYSSIVGCQARQDISLTAEDYMLNIGWLI